MALQLVRRMHHDHYLNRRKTPMTAAVLLIVPACSPWYGTYRTIVNRPRRSLDE